MCPAEVQPSPPFELAGRNVTLIEMPGFNDTLETGTEILELISTFLAHSYAPASYHNEAIVLTVGLGQLPREREAQRDRV